MNREEIIKLARDVGLFVPHEGIPENGAFMRFAVLVAAKEREACAQVCVDAIASIRGFGTEDAKQTGINVCINLAKAIRARSIT
jgi:hypothetical protein